LCSTVQIDLNPTANENSNNKRPVACRKFAFFANFVEMQVCKNFQQFYRTLLMVGITAIAVVSVWLC
jgi:Fe-S-cluster containining protein